MILDYTRKWLFSGIAVIMQCFPLHVYGFIGIGCITIAAMTLIKLMEQGPRDCSYKGKAGPNSNALNIAIAT